MTGHDGALEALEVPEADREAVDALLAVLYVLAGDEGPSGLDLGRDDLDPNAEAAELAGGARSPGPWWVRARVGGSIMTLTGATPGEAADAMARFILTRADCGRCGRPVTTRPGVLTTREPRCLYARAGDAWRATCDVVEGPR